MNTPKTPLNTPQPDTTDIQAALERNKAYTRKLHAEIQEIIQKRDWEWHDACCGVGVVPCDPQSVKKWIANEAELMEAKPAPTPPATANWTTKLHHFLGQTAWSEQAVTHILRKGSALEASSQTFNELLHERDDLLRQRDELLALVKRAQSRHASQGYMSMADQQLDDDMQAAIANTERGNQ